jgi:hypothetical protein
MKSLLGVGLLGGIVLIAAPAALAQPVTTTCLNSLNDHSHTCLVKSSEGPGSFPVALSFADGSLDAGTIPIPCSCATTGTFNNPHFKASKTKWICVGAEDDGAGGASGVVIQGTVGKSGKITKVTGADSRGNTYLFDCDLDSPQPE